MIPWERRKSATSTEQCEVCKLTVPTKSESVFTPRGAVDLTKVTRERRICKACYDSLYSSTFPQGKKAEKQ